MNDSLLWRFRAVDTWFFRESRPMAAASGGALESEFPPPARTVAGAMRAAIGEIAGVNWVEFDKARMAAVTKSAQAQPRGRAYFRAFESLRIQGPYVAWQDERLYPVPTHLLESDFALGVLTLENRPVECDLGSVRLPSRVTLGMPGFRPIENAWISREGFEAVLGRGTPPKAKLHRFEDLFVYEPRLGIGRERDRHVAADERLYQTEHIRPRDGLEIWAVSRGIAPEFVPKSGMVKFGAEGRLAAFETAPGDAAPPPAGPPSYARGLAIVFLTPAQFLTDAPWNADWTQSPRFEPKQHEGADCWETMLLGDIHVRIVSAAAAPAVYEGGWDAAAREPRAVGALLPAGSVWFCSLLVNGEAAEDASSLEAAAKRLTGRQLGYGRSLGRGEIAVGYW